MNFINKNILLCLALAIPFAHAGQANSRPWYTRLFGGYSAAIVGTAVVTSLGWWYFGVKGRVGYYKERVNSLEAVLRNADDSRSKTIETLQSQNDKNKKIISLQAEIIKSLEDDDTLFHEFHIERVWLEKQATSLRINPISRASASHETPELPELKIRTEINESHQKLNENREKREQLKKTRANLKINLNNL